MCPTVTLGQWDFVSSIPCALLLLPEGHGSVQEKKAVEGISLYCPYTRDRSTTAEPLTIYINIEKELWTDESE